MNIYVTVLHEDLGSSIQYVGTSKMKAIFAGEERTKNSPEYTFVVEMWEDGWFIDEIKTTI